ncbi:hypothetical protein BB561_001399 [Smittium simulii]|uniref:FH2 domain-containing protein n=1 Tax=Smittium simulii TaxID=133385 RepID=A0A2T9YUQ3_9FUNG|nr:hypothetical protein BB561_001399 [Smittium simulii]
MSKSHNKKGERSIKGFFNLSDRKRASNESKSSSNPSAQTGSIKAFFNSVASNRNSSLTINSGQSNTSSNSIQTPLDDFDYGSSQSIVNFTNTDMIDFELEQMMHDMNLKDEQRDAMRGMTNEKKILLIQSKSQYSEFKGDKARPGAFCRVFKNAELTGIDLKNLVHLRVCLTTQPILWVKEFVERDGLEVLTELLTKISTPSQRLNNYSDTVELEIIRCMKVIMNIEWGAHEAIEISNCISTLCFSLDSKNILVRKITAEILTFVCYVANRVGYKQVLEGLDYFCLVRSETIAFGAWLAPFEKALDTHLSFIKLNKSYSQADVANLEKEMVDMSVANIILVNSLLSLSENANTRISYRTMLEQAGIQDIISKLRRFKNDMIDLQIDTYERELKQDYEEILDSYESDDIDQEPDVNSLLDSLKSLLSAEDKDSEYVFSIIQSVVLLNDPTFGGQSSYKPNFDSAEDEASLYTKRLKIVEELVNRVGIENKIPTNISILSQRQNNVRDIINSFSNEDSYEDAVRESIELRKKLEEVTQAKVQLEQEVSNKSDGLVGSLKGKIGALEDLLRISRHTIEGLQTQNKELRKKFTERLLKQENRLKQLLKTVETVVGDVETLTVQRDGYQLENTALRNPAVWIAHSIDDTISLALDLNKLESEIKYLKEIPSSNVTTPANIDVIEKALLQPDMRLQKNNLTPIAKPSTLNRPKAPKKSPGLPKNEPLHDIFKASSSDALSSEFNAEKNLDQQNTANQDAIGNDIDDNTKILAEPKDILNEKIAGSTKNNSVEQIQMSISNSPETLLPSVVSVPTSIIPPIISDLSRLFSSPDGINNISLLLPLPRKELKYIPKKKLKMLQWDKLSDREQLSQTLWFKYDSVSLIPEDSIEKTMNTKGAFDRLEELFAAKEAVDLNVLLLSPKRANNINIMLGRLKKFTIFELKSAIVTLDNSVISENLLKQFLVYAPSPEEKALLSAQKQNDLSSLAKADRFLVEMCSIFRYEKRLSVMVTRLSWDERYRDLQTDIDSVTLASLSVSSSKGLSSALGIILIMGNYMNGTGFRGGAYGFKIQSLTKLMDTKALDNKITLLHFLAGIIEDDFPELLDFLKDLKPVESACRVSYQELRIELNDLTEKMEEAKKELSLHLEQRENDSSLIEIDGSTNEESNSSLPLIKSSEDLQSSKLNAEDSNTDLTSLKSTSEFTKNQTEDLFIAKISEFIEINDPRLEFLINKMERMDKVYMECSGFFGENISTMEPDEFFGIFRTFTLSFEKALKDNLLEKKRKLTADKRRVQIEAAIENRKKSELKLGKGRKSIMSPDRSAPGSASNDGSSAHDLKEGSPEKGAMDDLLKSLRQGNILGRPSLGGTSDKPSQNTNNTVSNNTSASTNSNLLGTELRKPRRRDLNAIRNSTLRRSLHRTSISIKAMQMLKEIDNNSIIESITENPSLNRNNLISEPKNILKLNKAPIDTIEEESAEVTIEQSTHQSSDTYDNRYNDFKDNSNQTGSQTRDFKNYKNDIRNQSGNTSDFSISSSVGGDYESD